MTSSVDNVTRGPEFAQTFSRERFEAAKQPERLFILGVRVDNLDARTALEGVCSDIGRRVNKPMRKVFFANVHTVHLAGKDEDFLNCVNAADWVLPDGSGLAIAGLLFESPIRENLNGTDFTPRVLEKAERNRWSVYLLGAHPDVLRSCTHVLKRRFPGLKIAGSHSGYFSRTDEPAIVDDINTSNPDILLVALGSPLQEQWIERHAHELRVGVAMAVGGLFDFLSGNKKRAPGWMRKAGIEWVYRFFQDPGSKWDRVFIEIPLFVVTVFTAWLRTRGRSIVTGISRI